MPSIKKNVAFNYIGRFYVAFAGILVLPLYLKHMGAEAFGLIGFFTLLQSWMQLLDLGLSPTLGREVASARGRADQSQSLRGLVRSLETIFLCIATVVGLSLFMSKGWIAGHWLTINELDAGLVAHCVGLMGLMVGVRWFVSLHRSGINAYEQQVWINVVDGILTTLRFPGALLLVILSKGDIVFFFYYQLLLALVELVVIARKFYQLLPAVTQPVALFSIPEMTRVLPFALGIAYTGGIWVLVSQLDKLLLSKLLSLAEYGYFSLVAVVCSGLLVLSAPVSNAVLPRMTLLLAQGKNDEMLALYRKATRLVVCMVVPVALVITFFPRQVVQIWTGDGTAADWTEPVLPLFALGNGLLAIGAFQYYLQYAHGKLRLHVLYNTVSAVISVPMIVYAAHEWGPVGVGYVWLVFRLLSLLFWTPYVHKVLAPGLHADWLLKDIMLPLLPCAGFLAAMFWLLQDHFPAGRLDGFLTLAVMTLLATGIAMLTAFFNDIQGRLRARV